MDIHRESNSRRNSSPFTCQFWICLEGMERVGLPSAPVHAEANDTAAKAVCGSFVIECRFCRGDGPFSKTYLSISKSVGMSSLSLAWTILNIDTALRGSIIPNGVDFSSRAISFVDINACVV